jgi:hypothetical protein
MADGQRYYVDGLMRTRPFFSKHPEDQPHGGALRTPTSVQPPKKIQVGQDQVNKNSNSVLDSTTRKDPSVAKEKSSKGDKKKTKKSRKEKSASPGLLKILCIGGRWAHDEDVEPGVGNRTSYAGPGFGWRPFGGTR